MKLNELKKVTKGVCVVQTTPFNKDGSLDLPGMRANTRWLLEKTRGKHFIFTPLGSTGEFTTLSEDECKAIIKMVVEEVNGAHPVIPGTGRAGTAETVKWCQFAQSVGADGVQVILPYYHIPQEEGMYLHFKTISESVSQDFGITLYNNPDVSGSWITPPLMKRITQLPNIIAVKENTQNVLSFYMMQKAVDPADASIFCGFGEEMYAFVAQYNCAGVVSSVANFMPDFSYAIYEAAVARDHVKVFELWESISSFWKLGAIVNGMVGKSSFTAKMSKSHGPSTGVSGGGAMFISVVKAAMDIMGLRGGEVRLPLIGITEQEKAELASILKTMKLVK